MVRKIADPDPMFADIKLPARERLLLAGGNVFANKGYGGASVREICELAGTSSNMIHHYFGSKQSLYDEILSGFSERVLEVPIRILSEASRSSETFMAIMDIFIRETLEALVTQPDTFRLVVRENIVFKAFEDYNKQLIKFLEDAKSAGIVRPELDSEMLTGFILDRLGNQILYASWIKEASGQNILSDGTYRRRWLRANVDLILHGTMTGA